MRQLSCSLSKSGYIQQAGLINFWHGSHTFGTMWSACGQHAIKHIKRRTINYTYNDACVFSIHHVPIINVLKTEVKLYKNTIHNLDYGFVSFSTFHRERVNIYIYIYIFFFFSHFKFLPGQHAARELQADRAWSRVYAKYCTNQNRNSAHAVS